MFNPELTLIRSTSAGQKDLSVSVVKRIQFVTAAFVLPGTSLVARPSVFNCLPDRVRHQIKPWCPTRLADGVISPESGCM
jgi:hypothetical protein